VYAADDVSARERVAGLLHRSGALQAVSRLRRALPLQRVRILTYHHVSDQDETYPYDPDVADATPAQFRRQMEMLARYGTAIGIDDLLRAIDGAPLPANPVMVTFDDGYRSCHDVALPILRAVGLRATFFVSTSFVADRRLYWWEKLAFALQHARKPHGTIHYPREVRLTARDAKTRAWANDLIKDTPGLDVDRFVAEVIAALDCEWSDAIEREHAERLIMTWDHVRALARAGMDVESHTRHHRVLRTLAPHQLAAELAGSRADLEAQLARPIRAVAYPVGQPIANHPHLRDAVVAAGYQLGFTNTHGSNRVWPRPLAQFLPVDRFDVGRLPTDRAMSDAMWLTQLTFPNLSYASRRD
jgi:peptidoglycan/xylan/chitin deacetylase (PgdA/CDA1 family)